jgi:predicted dehydrogenase
VTSVRPLRLIQAGVGGHGRSWCFDTVADHPAVEVVAIVDPDASALEAARERLGLPHSLCFASLEGALRATSASEPEALLSVTPPAAHGEQARLAFDARLHVLVEKPIAPDLATARTMVEQAATVGRQLMVGQNRRWDPEPSALKRVMDEQPVGAFGHGHVDFFLAADFRGSFRQTMPHVLLVDMAVHHVDLVRYVLGRDVKRVFAQDFNPAWSSAEDFYRDGAALRMVLTLSDDTVVSYAGDWSARGRPNSWQGAWTLQCAGGRIEFDDSIGGIRLTRGEAWGRDVVAELRPIPPGPSSQQQLLDAFIEAVRTNIPGMTSGADNLKTIAAVLAAVESCETGFPVDLPGV